MSSKKSSRRDIPVFTHPIVETHCHLDYLKSHELDELLEKVKTYNIEKIITIAVEPNNLKTVFDLAQKHSQIWGTQGIHPHQSGLWDNHVKEIIKENLKQDTNSNIVAIGEIGLDYYYDKNPRNIQIKAFEEQIQLATDNDLPFVIHSRDAEEDTMAILKNVKTQIRQKAVIHSFTSKIELAELAIDLDLFLGFNGIITFKNAKDVQSAVEIAPLSHILLETDAPFLTPVPYRGKENAPFYLPFIAEKVAELKQTDVLEVLQKTYRNSHLLFTRLQSN